MNNDAKPGEFKVVVPPETIAQFRLNLSILRNALVEANKAKTAGIDTTHHIEDIQNSINKYEAFLKVYGR